MNETYIQTIRGGIQRVIHLAKDHWTQEPKRCRNPRWNRITLSQKYPSTLTASNTAPSDKAKEEQK